MTITICSFFALQVCVFAELEESAAALPPQSTVHCSFLCQGGQIGAVVQWYMRSVEMYGSWVQALSGSRP